MTEPSIEIEITGLGSCRVVHRSSGARLETETPPEYDGTGAGFSSTDLVAAGLGSCIASSLAPVAARESIPLEAIRIRVTKHLTHHPRRIGRLEVDVHLPVALSPRQRTKLERAAATCPVHRSLGPWVEVVVRFLPT